MKQDIGVLPVTRWSLVARAGGRPGEVKHRALAELLSLYMPALQAHLAFHKHLPPQICEDLLQEFVAKKVLDRDIIAKADKEVGRFRTFLLTSLDRFVINQIRNEKTYQRHQKALADYLRAEGRASHAGPVHSEAFDVTLARQILSEALASMRKECQSTGRSVIWKVFDGRVLAPLLREEQPTPYEVLARELELDSVKQASNLLVTAKRMYGRILRRTIGRYRIGDEISELREILAHASA